MTIAIPLNVEANSFFMPAKLHIYFEFRLNKYRKSRNLLAVSGFFPTFAIAK